MIVKDIALQTGRTPNTVRKHARRLGIKLGVGKVPKDLGAKDTERLIKACSQG